jgi:hypothetical protein
VQLVAGGNPSRRAGFATHALPRGAGGQRLDAQTVGDQYRLFSVYSWIAAVSTAAMGSQWQPVEVTRPALISTTTAIEDLDVMGLLSERL